MIFYSIGKVQFASSTYAEQQEHFKADAEIFGL